MRKLMLVMAMGLMVASALATADLPWVYDDTQRPAEVTSEGAATPAVSAMTKTWADADALDYFNSFWRQTFDLEGRSVYVYRGLLFIVK